MGVVESSMKPTYCLASVTMRVVRVRMKAGRVSDRSRMRAVLAALLSSIGD